MESLTQSSIHQSINTFRLNHRLFLNCLVGMNDSLAKERISDHSNSFIWIATHTLWARYNVFGYLGKPLDNPYKSMFGKSKAHDPSNTYPSLEALRTEWEKVGDLLKEALHSASEEFLATESAFKSPIPDHTNAGTVAFFAQHESWHIGQMAFLKKYFTKEAMKY
jgi:hypothetical protein